MTVSSVSPVVADTTVRSFQSTAERIQAAREWAEENAPPEPIVPIHKRASASATTASLSDMVQPGDEVTRRLLDIRA